jgi:hypothetical protein
MADKAFDPEDPMGLVAVGVEGDEELQAECLVEEFVRLGLGDRQLLTLFQSPAYAGAHAIYRRRGEAWVRGLIARTRARWGQPRFTVREPREEA